MKKIVLSSLLLLSVSAAVLAQDFKTGYFLDNYTYSYRLNPAAPMEEDSYSFFAVGLGNVTAEARSNLGIYSFFRPVGDEYYFFTESDVPVADALSGFAENNSVLAGAKVNVFTFGRQLHESRFSVELNARTDNSLVAPYDFFSLIKHGLYSLSTGEIEPRYQFSGVSLNSNTYAELAFNFGHKVGDVVTLGATLKGLVGFASAALDWDLDVVPGTGAESLKGACNFDAHIASPMTIPFANYTRDGKTYYDPEHMTDNMDIASAWKNNPKKVGGWGLAADLGITIEPFDGLSLEASILDLGFMSWNSTFHGKMEFSGQIPDDDYKEIFEIEDLTHLKYTNMLNFKVHAGAKYRMPFYDGLSVGVLGTYQKNFREVRLGLDFTPIRFISLAASAGFNNFGTDFGAAMNIRFPGVNFFVGTDALYFKMNKFIPTEKVNTLLTAGLVIAI